MWCIYETEPGHYVVLSTCPTQALEYSQQGEMVPSCILPLDQGRGSSKGALYLGGFRAVMNHEFLKQNNIGHVLNTAFGLEKVFGPKYTVCVMHTETTTTLLAGFKHC